jgi:uncharacterized protein YfaS (alpha-2-macroglobulin family)
VAPQRALEVSRGETPAPEPFGVVFTGPTGKVGVDAQLNLVFSRPLRELGPAETEGVPPIGLSPNLDGRWRWVGTSALLFEPRAGRLPQATSIELTLPAGVRALDGSRLEQPLRVALETPRPQVVGSIPYEGQRGLAPNQTFELRFNQAVDPRELERAARLLVRRQGVERSERFRVSLPDAESPQRLTLTPARPLPPDHTVTILLDPSLRGREGPLPAGAERTLQYETYGPLSVEDVHCPRGPSEVRCAPGQSLSLALSNEVTLRDAKRALTLEPALPITWESWRNDDEHVSYLDIQAPFAAGTTYTIRLAPGLQDVYGQKLGRPFVREVTMDDYWPRLEVALQGDSFEPSAQPSIPVASVNVPEYTLIAAPLSPAQVAEYLAQDARGRPFDMLLGLAGVRPHTVRPGPTKNRVHTEPVDPQRILKSGGGRGAVVIATRRREQDRVEETRRLLQVTELALTAKLGRAGSVVWVTELSSGKPVAGAEVRILGPQGVHPGAVLTDAAGLAQLPPGALGPAPEEQGHETLVVARRGADWAFRQVSDYLSPWRMTVAADPFAKQQSYGLLFTERGLYRPGDEVQIKGILRREATTGNEVLSGKRLTLVLRSPDWQEVGTWPVTTNAFGTFAQSIIVPRTASLGSWRIEVKEFAHERDTSTSFEVAEYRPAEIQARVASAAPSYRRGAQARFEVQGDYLYGAPMAGAELTYMATRRETSWQVPGLDGFTTDASLYDSAYPEKAPSAGVIAQGEAKLDDTGKYIHAVPLELPGQLGPELVSFDAEVRDVSRQAAGSGSSAIVHPADVYVALKTPTSYFHTAPTTLRPQALVVSPEGQPQPGRRVRLQLIQRRWTLARLTQAGSVRSETRVVDETVDECTFESAREPKECALKVGTGGYYVLLATAQDGRGRTARAAIDTYALGQGQAFWRDDDAGRLELVLDKPSYRSGETARVLVKSPFPDAQALVTVESDGVVEQRTVLLRGPTPTFEVPVSERFRPNAFVSVHLIRPRSATPPDPGKADLGAPTYRVGHAELRVDAEARRLRVALSPNKRELRPGEEIEVAVEVKDATGRPAPSEVTLYAVDEGVLSLIGYRTPDPLPVFTAPRPLRTVTLESRASLGRVVADLGGLLGLGGNKGAEGGGGGEAGSGARRDFRQSVYFNPTLQTGADGKARVRFRLPESLTTYRVMAVVASREDRYGYAEERVVTNKRLMARPALPRLLRAGDHAEAGVVVSSKGLAKTSVRVTLDAEGVEVLGPRTQELELLADRPREVRFTLRAPSVGQARLRFTASGGQHQDAVEVTRDIQWPATLETVALYGETKSAAAEALGDLTALRKDLGGLEVQTASTALVGIDAGFEQLIEFPYGCTEQLSSKLLPLLPLRSLAQTFGTQLPGDVDRIVEKSVAEILSRQQADGGFAMWPESAGSSPWVSAYATWTLHEAARRKVPIPLAVMDRAKQYLRGQLERDRDDLWLASAPFWVDVLATLGAPDSGYMSELFQQRDQLPTFSRALLLHALATSKQPKEEVAALTREIEAAVHIEANRAFATENLGTRYAVLMDSPARTTALVLRGLLAARPDHPLGSRLARGLLEARRGGTWRSTQETAFALLALDEYRRAQEKVSPDFVARLWFGDDKLAEHAFRRPSGEAQQSRIAMAQLGSGRLVFEKEGAGTLFYEARLRYARTTLPTGSLERGFFVQKTLRPVTAASLPDALAQIPSQGVTTVAPGSLVLADLLLVAPGAREYVVLDDPLPAGLEAVDARLATTASWARISGSRSDDEPPTGDDMAHHRALLPSHYRQELRDDRVLFFVDHLPAGVYHYRYLARATTPGTFVVPPTQAEEMYNPEVFGRTGAIRFEVR